MRNQINQIGVILISGLLLSACTSPWVGECWEHYQTNEQTPISEEQVIGTYTLDKDERVFSSFKNKAQNNTSIEFSPDHTFKATNFIDFDSDSNVSQEISGTWKLGVTQGYRTIDLSFNDTKVPSGSYLIGDNGGLMLTKIVRDPDSCEGVVYRKASEVLKSQSNNDQELQPTDGTQSCGIGICPKDGVLPGGLIEPTDICFEKYRKWAEENCEIRLREQ